MLVYNLRNVAIGIFFFFSSAPQNSYKFCVKKHFHMGPCITMTNLIKELRIEEFLKLVSKKFFFACCNKKITFVRILI